MATYPDDATVSITAFPVISDVTYTNTGSSRTDFNLSTAVAHRGEVLAIIDGITQETDSYSVSNGGATASFLVAPDASNLTLKAISIPDRFRLTKSFPQIVSIDYSNSTPKTVSSNTYLLNANTESFAFPASANVGTSGEFLVFLNGVFQDPSAYTFPSVLLGNQGIDIGDNTASKLILNFNSNLTDESPDARTVTAEGSGSYAFGSAYNFAGTNFLTVPSDPAFDIHNENFTIDTEFRLSTDAFGSNQALLTRYVNNDNYYEFFVDKDTNVVFYVNSFGLSTQVRGGNVNALSNYHVAVSYEHNAQNLRLYVNNVLVDHTGFVANATPAGPIEIGNANALVSTLDATMNFMRFAKSARYRGASIQPLVPTANYQATIISGAPLGSIDQGDKLSIRIFDSEVTSLDRFSSMADRKPDRGITSERAFDAIKFESQSGYEKRRLRSRRAKRKYNISYTNVTGIEKTAIEDFYTARSGEFQAFSFDLSHINESGTITTRFDGPLKINQVLSTGPNLTQNFYTVQFNLQEVYD